MCAWGAPATAVVGDIITASFWNTNGRDNLNYLKGTAGDVVFEDGILVSADPTATSGTTGFGTTTGVGDAADANLQAPAQGTGGGPVSLVATNWFRVTVGINVGWVPFFS